MHKLKGLRAALAFIAMVITTFVTPVAAQTQEPNPENIGFVIYTKTTNPGTLIARWNYQNRDFG